MENKSNKRKFKGVVVSNKTDKTVVVETKRLKTHKKYGKKISISKKFMAHDEENKCVIGDTVVIEETKPMSKMKKWRVTN
ncbi:30S ribosomal protein S17 [bacterium]|nr:MAG: 30S ribosomal protein S17 [bacterium]